MKEQKAQQCAGLPPVSSKYKERNVAAFVFKGKWFETASHMAQFALSLLFLGIPFFLPAPDR